MQLSRTTTDVTYRREKEEKLPSRNSKLTEEQAGETKYDSGLPDEISDVIGSHEQFTQMNLHESQRKLLDEMASTEGSYVKDLELLKECVNKTQGSVVSTKRSLKDNKELEKVLLDKLCFVLRDLCSLHQELFIRLKTALSKQTEDVADIYEDFCKNLSIYDQYMTVYYESQLNSIDLEEVPWLKDVCDRIQEVERFCGMTTGDAFFIPMQRLMRYSLLMSTFLRKIDDHTHPSVVKLTESLHCIKETTLRVDRQSGVQENMKKLTDLQRRIKRTNLFLPSRLFLLEALVDKINARGQLKFVQRKLFLFNDILLVCEVLEPHAVKQEICADALRIIDPTHLNDVEVDKSTVICLSGSGTVKALTFQFENRVYREIWLKTLSQVTKEASKQPTIEKAAEASDEVLFSKPPLYVRDESVTDCLVCHSAFTTFNRKHHCRACGNVVCKKCSKNRCILPFTKGEKERICDKCFELVEASSEESCSTESPASKNSQTNDKNVHCSNSIFYS